MPVIAGIEKFSRAMAAHSDGYVLIGGAACSVLFDRAGLDFRLTKDLDIVVIADRADYEFARDLWGFIKEGGYEAGVRREGECTYYRFQLAEDSPNRFEYPGQIELFARRPDFDLSDKGTPIAPLPFDGAVSSLSAIILDDEYYEFIRDGAISVDGLATLDALHIIPLKMRAHVDLNRKHEAGAPDGVNSKNLRKHRADVAELSKLLTGADRLALEGEMRTDAEAFFDDFAAYAARQTNCKIASVLSAELEFLKRVYL